ncbi:MAG: popeye domain-containing protein [Roseibium sp.]|uniref:cyclic nucleotide-binding domain-containing protein n=1 Tax=Roseibium sp. TaxID=1936156 RepID=UPI0026361825|nr:cyclic nucleotide-binding domain-containing protein [Roseibium sp.]MCV0427018.1 popeye domain-containing protein [Roseibium sp.]
MFGLDALVTVANVIYLFSYSVRDILWLRILTVVGATMLLPYYYFQIDPLWAAIAWNSIFIAINIFWIGRLLLDRRPVPFSAEERHLYQLALRNMGEREAFNLLRMGSHASVAATTELLKQGEPVPALMLIIDGEVNVEMDGVHVDTLNEGRFLGAVAYLSKEKSYKAPVTVRTTKPTRVITWQMPELESRVEKDSDLEIDLEASLGLEISRFLQTARTKLLAS